MTETLTGIATDGKITGTTTIHLVRPPVTPDLPKLARAIVRPVRLTAVCPAPRCLGTMHAGNGYTAGFGPTFWRHTCSTCGFVEWYDTAYPCIAYKEAK